MRSQNPMPSPIRLWVCAIAIVGAWLLAMRWALEGDFRGAAWAAVAALWFLLNILRYETARQPAKRYLYYAVGLGWIVLGLMRLR